MVSLGLILESGDGVAKDIAAANALYEKAAARGSADGAINLAVALMSGKGVEKNASGARRGPAADGVAGRLGDCDL